MFLQKLSRLEICWDCHDLWSRILFSWLRIIFRRQSVHLQSMWKISVFHFKTFMHPCKITRCPNLCFFLHHFLSKLFNEYMSEGQGINRNRQMLLLWEKSIYWDCMYLTFISNNDFHSPPWILRNLDCHLLIDLLHKIHILRVFVLWILQHNYFHSSAWEPRNLANCSPPGANIEQDSFFLVFL